MLTNNINESQAVLIVIPSDIGAYRRRGQVKGARLIHKLIKKMNFDTKILDYGELFLDHFSLENTHNQIEKDIVKAKSFEKPLLVIGGDHSISYGCMKSFPNSQVYMFDAHPDLIKDEKYITHGSFLRHFSNRAIIKGNRYQTKQERNDITNLKEIDTNDAYISIDLDVLDPSIMPGVSHPVRKGWDLNKLKNEISNIFEEKNVVCIDITEFSAIVEHKKSLKVIQELLDFLFQKFLSA